MNDANSSAAGKKAGRDELCLWYRKPAERWDQALPVGSGRLGAMVFGGTEREHIQLNEESVWGGSFTDRNNPDALRFLPEIRRAILENRIGEAERLSRYALTGIPETERPYQTLGDLYFTFYGSHFADPNREFAPMHGDVLNPALKPGYYRRELSLGEGIVRTEYRWDRGDGYDGMRREVFASAPDDVLVIRMEAEGEPLHFDCTMDRGRTMSRSGKISERAIGFGGSTGENGIRYACVLCASEVSPGGSVRVIGQHLIVEGASEVTLLLTAATSWRFDDPWEECGRILKRASEKRFAALKEAHTADYRALFDRMSISFDGTDEAVLGLPVDERLRRVREEGAHDPGLIALYCQYGRYLMISGSRPGTLPLTLQGIWCDKLYPIWDSKYTININTEMNYWPAESANLSECHLPLFDLLERMKPNGQETARRMYGCSGMAAHHNTDIYGDTAPQDMVVSSTYWPMGAAWLATHIMEHYDYTGDLEFLKEHYDTLCQNVIFFRDFLVEDEQGRLVTCPSVSPENTYRTEDGQYGRLTAGPAMDCQILTVLFSQFIKASEIMGRDEELREQAQTMLKRLPRPQTGRFGQIMEWRNDYEEPEPGHRHISQLYGVYPGSLFTAEDTPELMRAARTTLERRLSNGGGHTGWSRAWIILLWARMRDGQKVLENIEALLSRSTYDNLMDSHPLLDGSVFQIDGNFGAGAGITEMLVQDYHGRVTLLPALPAELSSGSLRGLKLRGGASLDVEWKNGSPVRGAIRADRDYSCIAAFMGQEREVRLSAGQKLVFRREDNADTMVWEVN